jgi:hypothetical protein
LISSLLPNQFHIQQVDPSSKLFKLINKCVRNFNNEGEISWNVKGVFKLQEEFKNDKHRSDLGNNHLLFNESVLFKVLSMMIQYLKV